jgi:hypothetical protein
MADFLVAKVATEVVTRRWPVPGDDVAASVATSASGVTVDSATLDDAEVVLTLSAGTAGQTATVTVTVTTEQGQTLIETLYIPIVASTAQIADTARDYINFALRKIVGLGVEPSADELADALERVNAIVARWRKGGADIGAAFPIEASTVIYCPDWAVSALRYNLLVECASLYGAEPSPFEYEQARRGLQTIKQNNVPAVKEVEYF